MMAQEPPRMMMKAMSSSSLIETLPTGAQQRRCWSTLFEHVIDEIRAQRSTSPKRFSRLQIALFGCRRLADSAGLFGSMRESFTKKISAGGNC